MASIVVDELITKLDYEADTSTLKAAEQATKQLEQQNRSAAAAADELSTEQRKLADQSDRLAARILDLKDQERKLKIETRNAGKTTADQRKKMHALRDESAKLRAQKSKLSLESRKLSRQQRDLSKTSRRAANDQRRLQTAMRDAADAARQEKTALGNLAETVQGVAGGQIAADAARTIATGIVELGKEVITTGANFESLRARLKTVEGSAEGAAQAFSLIQKFTTTTPYQLEEVTTAFVRLKSLGLDASEESLTAFGNLAAAQGKSIIDFIEAVADASTGEFERLKEFGIKASSQGDKVAFTFKGQTTTVGKNAAEIQAFLKGLGETEFAGAMADQMATTSGAISNFKDTIAQALDQVAQMGVLEEFNGLLKDIVDRVGGDDGLGKLIADVLVLALSTLRDILASMPQDGQIVEFFSMLVQVLGQLIEQIIKGAADSNSMISVLYEFATLFLEVASAIYGLLQRLDELKDRLGGIPGPLDMIVTGVKLVLKGFEAWADLITWFIEHVIDPLLDKLEQIDLEAIFADKFPRVSEGFSNLADKMGIFNTELGQTSHLADVAYDSLAKLYGLPKPGEKEAQDKAQRAQEDRAKADAAAQQRKAQFGKAKTRAHELLEHPKDLSRDQLDAMMRDTRLSEKDRKKVEKELYRRDKNRSKSGKKAAEDLRKSYLTADIEKQIEKLAKDAGKRAAARAQLRGGVTPDQLNQIELQERQRVQQNLTTGFQQRGELPPGLAADLVQTAAIPNLEQTGGRLAPPVITVNNTRVDVTGNTFEANVTVDGPVSATPQQVANAVVAQAQQVTFKDMGNAILNSLTSERR